MTDGESVLFEASEAFPPPPPPFFLFLLSFLSLSMIRWFYYQEPPKKFRVKRFPSGCISGNERSKKREWGNRGKKGIRGVAFSGVSNS